MKNFKKLIDELYKKVYTITNKERIQQKEQSDLKNSLTSALFDDVVAAIGQ